MTRSRKAIIIGASSGIGKALAMQLSKKGFQLGLVARRSELLTELQNQLPGKSYLLCQDITKLKETRKNLKKLIHKMHGLDQIIINAGIGIPQPNWSDELSIVNTNVTAFMSIAQFAFSYFEKVGHGHLIGISSVAGTRGGRMATAYCASKAFVSNYLEGLLCRSKKENLGIKVTNIIPGFIKTDMTKKLSYTFWMISAKKAAKQVYSAIKKNKNRVYISPKWALIAQLMKILPISIYSRI